ncbi:hypothetical protein [Clostridium sp.]|uniref:hypothetical protein n=1 Tax=Clostridium sp. TaxID=1506 RepID=UPI002908CB65|nr:hypothetical protein [Clostridium sp.]MDU5108533.1 hypothetical protein [Clostridium sp.]
MFSIRKFRDLIPYKKAISIFENILTEDICEKDINDIRIQVAKICGYIAQSQGCILYPNESKKHLNKALKWTSILEKSITKLNISDARNKEYKSEVSQIRKILIAIRKKVGGNING